MFTPLNNLLLSSKSRRWVARKMTSCICAFLEVFNLSDAAIEYEETIHSYSNQSSVSLSWLV